MQDVRKIRLEYRRVDGVRPQVCHGVYGGPAVGDTISLDFFSETERIPPNTEEIYDRNGLLVGEEPRLADEPVTLTRNVHTRLVMNREVARDVAKWLLDMVDYMDREDERLDQMNPHKD